MENKKSSESLEPRLDEFTVNGRNLFVTGFNNDLSYSMPDGLKGKLLGDISLVIRKTVTDPDIYFQNGQVDPMDSIAYEELTLRLASDEYCEDDEEDTKTESEQALRNALAAEIIYFSDVRLEEGMTLDGLWQRAVETIYTRKSSTSKMHRSISSSMQKPKRKMLAQGVLLQRDAGEYVEATDFGLSYDLKIKKSSSLFEYEDIQAFSHKWLLPYKAGLTFNGYESTEYLLGYLDFANSALAEAQERCQEIAGNPELVDWFNYYTGLMAEYKTSINSAKLALEKK